MFPGRFASPACHTYEASMTDEEIRAQILRYLTDDLKLESADLDSDQRLVSSGLIDSANLVRFATLLERGFDIEVPDQDITADNFDSVALTIAYVRNKRGA